jgi:hypothetical protein
MEMEQQSNEQREGAKKHSFSSKMGALIGCCFTACIATCLCACMITATIRFISWLL